MQVRSVFSLSLGCCPAIPRTRLLINIYLSLLRVSLLIITSFKCTESHTQEKANLRDSRFKDPKTLVRLPSDRRIPDRLRTQSHTRTHAHSPIHLTISPTRRKGSPPSLRFKAPAAAGGQGSSAATPLPDFVQQLVELIPPAASSAPARPRTVSGADAAAEDDNDDDDDNNEGDQTDSNSTNPWEGLVAWAHPPRAWPQTSRRRSTNVQRQGVARTLSSQPFPVTQMRKTFWAWP